MLYSTMRAELAVAVRTMDWEQCGAGGDGAMFMGYYGTTYYVAIDGNSEMGLGFQLIVLLRTVYASKMDIPSIYPV